jgi:ParB/RepB/Spo0J family partition protein
MCDFHNEVDLPMSQATIPLSKVRENKNALRTVDRTSEKYAGLVDSVRSSGILKPILVRECVDEQTGEAYYGLVDGLHRWSAAQDAGLSEIPVHIKNMNEIGVMMAQMMANVHTVETKPVEYSRQLVRILALDPLLTATQLATQLAKSPTWLNDRLGLTKLDSSIAGIVDEGKINLTNAYALSKLPTEEQATFLDRAITMPPAQFVPLANTRAKELRDAKRQGRDPNSSKEFVPSAHVRKPSELKEELQSKEAARILTQSIDNVVDAFEMGVAFSLHLDPISVQAQREKHEQQQKELEDAKVRRAQERAAQKEKAAAEKAAQVQSEMAIAQG